MFTLKTARDTGNKLGVTWNEYTPATLLKGMNVEREHKNVTHDDPFLTAKIAVAHLNENKSYYKYLKRMEKEMDQAEKPVKRSNPYMDFCKENRDKVKGLPVAEQGRKLGEMYRASKK